MGKRLHYSSASSEDEDEASVGNEASASPPPQKLPAVETDDISAPENVIRCSLPPHRETLVVATPEEFEVHYAKEHWNRCTACGKNFPTAHFLALHIDEHHNTFREALQSRGERTYACFVEGCDRLCSTPQKRRMHLIDKHMFPKMYNFRVVDTGIDKSTSMLHEGRRRRVSTTADLSRTSRHQPYETRSGGMSSVHSSVPRERKEAQGLGRQQKEREIGNLKSNKLVSDSTINDLATTMSALRFVPPSVANKQRKKPPPT
ncbi:hypothetical protein ABEF95_013600 [Exophiala dermatitidis]